MSEYTHQKKRSSSMFTAILFLTIPSCHPSHQIRLKSAPTETGQQTHQLQSHMDLQNIVLEQATQLEGTWIKQFPNQNCQVYYHFLRTNLVMQLVCQKDMDVQIEEHRSEWKLRDGKIHRESTNHSCALLKQQPAEVLTAHLNSTVEQDFLMLSSGRQRSITLRKLNGSRSQDICQINSGVFQIKKGCFESGNLNNFQETLPEQRERVICEARKQ